MKISSPRSKTVVERDRREAKFMCDKIHKSGGKRGNQEEMLYHSTKQTAEKHGYDFIQEERGKLCLESRTHRTACAM